MTTASLHLDRTESHVANAIWTLIDNASVKVKRFILIKLNQQFHADQSVSTATDDRQAFMSFLDSLPMKSGEKVPADDNGEMALIDEKYSL